MCGRFTLTTNDYESVARAIDADFEASDAAQYKPRYNVAPTDPHPVVVRPEAGGRALQWGKWGMAAPWDRGKAKPSVHINARAETMASKGLFKSAFVHRRCGVVADGFFEWTGPKDDRRPIWFHTSAGGVIVFAGLYVDHADPDSGERTRRFAIVTTEANALVEAAHDRMPVVLSPGDLDLWLAPAPGRDDRDGRDAFTADLLALARPLPEDALTATRVSTRVNSVKNDDPECLLSAD